MNNLENLQTIKSLDKSNMLGSIQQLPLQCQQTQEELKNFKIPADYRKVNKIVLNGMGGSRLGQESLSDYLPTNLKFP